MSFSDTVDLERAYLKAVTTSIMMARTYLHQGKEEFFTSEERKFIFAFATNSLNDSSSLLTKAIFEYEVNSRMEESPAANFIGEWNMVEGSDLEDPPEAILAKLRDAGLGRKALELSTDVIELLGKGDITEAVSRLKREAMMLGGQRDDRPMAALTDIEARFKLIRDKQAHPEKYRGLKIGFETFDKVTGGLYPGEMTLIAGITGLGKSTICRSIATGLTTLNGVKNVLHIANEEYLEQVQHKYDSVLTGIPYMDFKRATISEENLDRWQKYMQKEMMDTGRGQIFTKEVAAFSSIDVIEQQFRILENRGIPIHAIIIDHLPNVKPMQPAWGENDETKKAAVDCKELARWLKVATIVPTQAATDVEKKQMAGKRAGKLDVFGSKGQIHVANTFLILTYKGTDDTQLDVEERDRDVFWLCDVKKQRDGPPFFFYAKHLVHSGKIIEIVDPSKKATKEAKDAADANLKEAGEKTAKAALPCPPAATPTVAPVVLAGTRDSSMKALAALDGDEEEEDEEVMPAAQESQDTAEVAVVEEIVKEAEVEQPDPEIARLEEAQKAAEKNTTLGRLRGKKIQLGGV